MHRLAIARRQVEDETSLLANRNKSIPSHPVLSTLYMPQPPYKPTLSNRQVKLSGPLLRYPSFTYITGRLSCIPSILSLSFTRHFVLESILISFPSHFLVFFLFSSASFGWSNRTVPFALAHNHPSPIVVLTSIISIAPAKVQSQLC